MIDPEDTSEADWPASELARLADQIRSPFLTLGPFLDEPADTDDGAERDEAEEELALLAAGVSAERLQEARLRRAGLLWAANRVVDRCIEDLALQDWDPQTQLLVWDEDDSGLLDEPFLWTYFPARFRHAYTRDFISKILASAVKVGYDLARPDAGYAACMAEELILSAICRMANEVWDLSGLGPPWLDPEELLLEDSDYEVLFDEEMDGIEDDAALQLDRRMSVPGIQDWFAPFNSARIVHPYCATEHSGPRANDLQHLLHPDEEDRLRDPTIVDDPAPLAGLDAMNDAVQQAREEQEAWRDDVWVPNASRPEQSFADMQTLLGGQAASGWLTWVSEEGSDRIRTQPVIHFQPHRHFPAAPDQPWAEVTQTSVIMYVPLSAVVAFRVDPEVRQAWEQTFKDLAGGGRPDDR